jgi:hypothetical protein
MTADCKGWLMKSGVAVEKLDLSKPVEKTLRQEALQTTFLIFLDIFYPQIFCRFEKNEVFQQPQAIARIGVLRVRVRA